MRLTDYGGLYLEVQPNGAKHWRWKYRFADKEKRLALGSYPTVSLSKARSDRDPPGLPRQRFEFTERPRSTGPSSFWCPGGQRTIDSVAA